MFIKREATTRLTTALAICLLLNLQAACTYTPVYDSQGRPQPGSPDLSETRIPNAEETHTENDRQPDTAETPIRIAVISPDSVEQKPTISNKDIAAAKLRTQAADALAEGQSSKAERLLNRALRISPRSPETYYQLAGIKLKQGVSGQALQLARKGLSLCDPESLLATQLQALASQASNF